MNNATIGDRIKNSRKRLGMTQEQLAARLGVSAQAVSKWENNLSCPDISVLPELAEVFGISVDELLGKTPPREAAAEEPVHDAEFAGDEPLRRGVVFRPGNDEEGFVVSFGDGKRNGIFFAVYILVIGSLMLMNTLCDFPVSWWTVVWTTGLIFLGLSSQTRHFSLFSTVMSLAGLYFLLSAYDVIRFRLSWSLAFPTVLVLWGACLLIDVLVGNRRWRKRKKNQDVHVSGFQIDRESHQEFHCDDGWLRCELRFGDYRAAVVTPLLRGGEINSSFGDFKVDLSGCEALAPDCRIEIDNSFGELSLLVPDRFSVMPVSDSNFAAGTNVEGHPCASPQGRIHLEIDNSFGNVVIKYV